MTFQASDDAYKKLVLNYTKLDVYFYTAASLIKYVILYVCYKIVIYHETTHKLNI